MVELFISHVTPKEQIFKNFLGHGTILSTDRVLASSIVMMDDLDAVSGHEIYPLYQPSFQPQINSSAFGLKSKKNYLLDI